jgi:hypothetical protein
VLALSLTEPLIDAAIAKLRQNVPARIAAINGEYADAVVARPPQDGDYYFGGMSDLARAPAVIVTDGGTGDQDVTAEEGPHSLGASFDLLCFLVEEDTDRQRLARRLLRLERAVIESLWDSDPREQLVVVRQGVERRVYIRPVRLVPGPVFEPAQGSSMYRQWRAVVFRALSYDT